MRQEAFNKRNYWGLAKIAFNNIFDPIFNDRTTSNSTIPGMPVVNITETDTHYHIELETQGSRKEDFLIDLDREILNIEKKSKETENLQLALPGAIDIRNIETECIKGVLKFRLVKRANRNGKAEMNVK